MKMKKCGIFAVMSAVVLVAALLVSGCFDPIGKLNLPGNDVIVDSVTGGKATLIINIGDVSGRTIIPQLADNAFFDYVITVEDNSGITGPFMQTVTSTSAGFEVDDGEYTVTVEARRRISTDPDVFVVVAKGEDDEVDVIGQSGTANILLEVIDDGTTGQFFYDIAVGGYETATILIQNSAGTDIDPGVAYVKNLKTVGANTATLTLDSGYYIVYVTIGNPRFQSRTIREELHIYQGMISRYVPTFALLIQNNFDITYVPDGGTLAGGNTTTADWNSLLTEPTVTEPPAGKAIEGWYLDFTAPDTFANRWVFGTRKVYGPVTLYAQWEDYVAPLIVNITFKDPNTTNGSIVAEADATTITMAQLVTPGIELTSTEATTTWLLSLRDDPVFVELGSGATLVLTQTDIEAAIDTAKPGLAPFDLIELIVLDFYALVTIGGVDFNATMFSIQITQ